MNSVLAAILETDQVTGVDGKTQALHTGSVPRQEGEFLQVLIADTKPKVSLEVGLAHGISALFICDALREVGATRHIIIDPYQVNEPPWGGSFEGVGLNNLKKAGFEDLIDFYGLRSDRALPQLEAQQIRIDFAFIDGFHTFDHALIDFFYIDRLLNVGGLVVFDDVNWPGIRKLCRFIATNRSYRVFRCLGPLPGTRSSLKRRLVSRVGALASQSRRIRSLLNPEITGEDVALGLTVGSRCIAFQKQSEDNRPWWDVHRDF